MRKWPFSLLPVALVIAAAPFAPSPDHRSGGPVTAQERAISETTQSKTGSQTTSPATP